MEKAVKIHPFGQVTHQEFNNFGLFPRESLDHIVLDGIEPGRAYTGFGVAQAGPFEILIGNGRLFNQGKVFFRATDGGYSINLSEHLPQVTRRIVSVVVWGQEIDTQQAPRSFVTNVETETVEPDDVATESWRVAQISVVSGTENSDPAAPAVDANVVRVANIVLTPAGIESITMVAASRLPSVRGNTVDIAELKGWRNLFGQRLDTLGTDLAGLADRQRGLARADDVQELLSVVALMNARMAEPVDAVGFGAYDFVAPEIDADTEHPDYLCRFEQGLRFPSAQERVAQLALANPTDERIKVQSNFVLPAFTETARVVVDGEGGEISLSQYAHQTDVEIVEKTVTRKKLQYGPIFYKSTSNVWTRTAVYDPVARTLYKPGEGNTYLILESNVQNPNRMDDRAGQLFINNKLQQVWEAEVEETYWERIPVITTLSGSICGQTFLCSQDGLLTSVELNVTRKGATGNVHMLVCDVNDVGRPAYDQVIARTMLEPAQLALGWTKFPVPPTLLEKGKRYGIILVTTGQHFIRTVENNKYGEGTMFISVDGAWAQGSLTTDFAMKLNFAQFATPRIEVPLEPLELENGIAQAEILTEMIRPAGTELVYEVKGPTDVWRTLGANGDYAFTGLPSLTQFRAVFIGTTDLMPVLGLGPRSQVITSRPRTDMAFVSRTETVDSPIAEVEVRMLVTNWDDNRHDYDIKVLTGGAFSTEHTIDLSSVHMRRADGAYEVRAVIGLSAPATDFKILIEADTNTALDVPCVEWATWQARDSA